MEPGRDLLRQIDVADSQVDHVGEGVEVPETAGAVLDDSDDAIDTFSDGIGCPGIDEGHHGLLMFSQGMDKLAHGRQSAEQSAFGPALQKALGGPGCLEVPELLELLFQAPGAIDPAVVLVERPEIPCLASITLSGRIASSGLLPDCAHCRRDNVTGVLFSEAVH